MQAVCWREPWGSSITGTAAKGPEQGAVPSRGSNRPVPAATTAVGMLQRLLRPWLSPQPGLQLCRGRDVGGDAELGSATPAPAAVRAECPERPAGGWPGDLTLQLGGRSGQELGFHSLPGQACRPQGGMPLVAGPEERGQKGGLRLSRGEASSGLGAGSERGSAGRGHPGPALGELTDGLEQGQGRCSPDTIHCVTR